MGRGADHWLETAESVPGSWWTHWDAWLKGTGGKEIPAPDQVGSKDYPEIEAAPGAYVLARTP
jgi:polyhydroxyalkanoate synthase